MGEYGAPGSPRRESALRVTLRPMIGDYTIEVADFGPITYARVEARPLTIFIGPSNTGKSYLATLIYALHQGFGGPDSWRAGGRFIGHEAFSLRPRPAVSETLREQLLTWFVKRSIDVGYPEIPAALGTALFPSISDPLGLAEHVNRQLLRYFGSVGDLVRRPSSSTHAQIALNVRHKALPEQAHFRFLVGEHDPELAVQMPAIATFPLDKQAVEQLEGMREFIPFSADHEQPDVVLGTLLDVVFRSILRPLCRDAYYFPTDRPGLMQSHQVIVATLVQNASTAALRPQTSVPMLSGVLADFLDQLLRLDRPTGRMRLATDRLDMRLQELLKGEIRLTRPDAGHPRLSYRPKGWRQDLPLFRASSMISELAPVVLFLRYAIRPGDVIVIDEPEAHLHPAMQADFARELAWLVRAGVRVLMTTHSEWVLETIGNLVRASGLAEGKRRGLRSAEVALHPDEVGAWLFRHKTRPKGSVVEEIELDPETGLYPTDFDEVSQALYNEGATIFNRMQEEETG